MLATIFAGVPETFPPVLPRYIALLAVISCDIIVLLELIIPDDVVSVVIKLDIVALFVII